jgi:GNAT superfamily N-acetyltransferase
VTVRSARPADIPVLCALYTEFHQFHVQGVPERLRSADPQGSAAVNADLKAAVESILQDDDSAIFVAEPAGRIVGLAEVYFRRDEANPLRLPYSFGYLQSLVVQKSHRSRGIGTLLLRAAEDWAREKGASEMRVETWEFRQGSLPFYDRAGYRTLRRTLVHGL